MNPRFRTRVNAAEIARAKREAAARGALISLTRYDYAAESLPGETVIVLCQLSFHRVEAHVVQRTEKAYGYGSMETRRYSRVYETEQAFETLFHADRKDFADFTRVPLTSLAVVA